MLPTIMPEASFLYVDDAAKALLLLAEKGRNGEVYNVSSGKARPLKDYVEIIRSKVDPSAIVGYGDLPYGADTVMHLEGSISKIRKDTGFEPTTEFEEGIEKTIAWAKAYYTQGA